ncbi:MAG: ABC transporter permease [Acidimicrobiales bacterium]
MSGILAAAAGMSSGFSDAEGVGISETAVLDQWQLPIGYWFDQMVDWADGNAQWFLDAVKWPFSFLLDNFVNDFLLTTPWYQVVLFTVIFGSLVRTPKIGITAGLGLMMCGLLGVTYWLETMRTIGMVLVSVGLCTLIGIPLGIVCARVDSFWNVTRPFLDAMQTVHSFVYMVPFVFFFSIGPVPATMVTMIYALPPLVRLTNLGIRQVPEDVVEASRAYGASELRVLTDVQLPLAKPAIMAGLNQTLMLAIAMVGIAAIMGASGLGLLVFRAVQNLDVGLGISSGLALWTVAVVLDRLSQPEGAATGSLLTRIRDAIANRSDPEAVLKAVEGAESEEQKAAKVVHVEHDVVATGRERTGMAVVGLGGFLAVIAVAMTWGSDAGLLSSHARDVDVEMLGQSFNGYQASGGSWAGMVVLAMGFFSLLAAVSCVFWTGGIGRLRGPAGLAALLTGLFGAVFLYPILGQFEGYATLANLEGHVAQAIWSVAIEVVAIPALLGVILGLAGIALPVSWRMVGVWAATAGLLGHLFEGPVGMAGEILAIAVIAVTAAVLAILNRTSLLDAGPKTWNNLVTGLVVAVLAMAVAPLSTVMDVKDIVALAAAGVVYRLLGSSGADQRTTLIGSILSGLALRWLVIGSIGSGDSALFLDIQMLATLGTILLVMVAARSGSRWFSADTMVITSTCMLVASLVYLVASPHKDVTAYTRGPGVVLAILASVVMLGGALLALQTAPYSAYRPLNRLIGWGRMATGIFALVLVLIGSISGWTFDERGASELPPEISEELDRLRDETNEFPAMAAANAGIANSLRNKYRMNAKTITDGLSEDGAGLSRIAILMAAIGLLVTVPASGLLGLDDDKRWRWSAVVAAVGGGLSLIGIIWIASLARVSDLNVVTGAGAFLTMFAGAILAMTSKKILTEYRRNKTYDAIETVSVH